MNLKLNVFWVSCVVAWLACEFGFADPGKLFAARKAELVSKYDANGDGRLDVQERGAMRQEVIKSKQSKKGEGFRRMMPPELLEAFDKDKDGEMNEAEQQVMNVELGKRFGSLVKTYDKNKDGELKGEELTALREASQSGTLKGLDTFLARMLMMQSGQGRRGSEEEASWDRFDRDGDGLASAEELKAIRNQEKQQR
ncbi:hypothetical protein OAM01_02565 [bacterium]|nr:hypothetical protein [bacterium]